MGRTAAADVAVDRPLRKDARRNREALLIAASEAYSERGVDASLEDIARRAGVGIGTLYRHFPTRDILNEAVYRREVDTLCDGATDLSGEPPVEALRTWMRSFASYVAKKRGMAMALKSALGPDNELFRHSHQRIEAAITALVERAVASGDVRPDADPEDLLRAMSGICMASDLPGWNDRTGRLIDLIVDGLRYGAPAPA